MKKIPLDKLSSDGFEGLRTRLNSPVLDKETLDKVRTLTGLDHSSPNAFRVSCDEAHRHSYKCLEFDYRLATIVERLVSEVERYRERYLSQAQGLLESAGYKKTDLPNRP